VVIANEDHPPLEVLVNESLISEVQVGQSVHLTLDAYPDQIYTGQVSRIDSSSAKMSQYPVTIELDNAEGVMPGMLIEAEIIADEHVDVLLAPRAALIWSQGKWSVDVWSSRRRQSTPVTVGIRTYDQAEIVSGLNEGDVVVIDPPPANTGEGMYTFSQMNPEGAVR